MAGISDTLPAPGCPSGLQTDSPLKADPRGGELDVTPFVSKNKDGLWQLDLIVRGAKCAGCMSKIENGLTALPGVKQARLNLSTLRLAVRWKGEAAQGNTIVKTLTGLGYGAAPWESADVGDAAKAESRHLLLAMAIAGFAAMNVMLMSISVWSGHGEMAESTRGLFHWLSAAIALPVVAFCGQTFFKSAWSVLKHGRTNMDVPISLAIILACGLSLYETWNHNPDIYFDAALMLVFLLLIGRYLDAKLRLRTGEAARQLAALQSSSATRIKPDGGLETVAASQINPGDHLLIPAGQRIPVDGEILDGRSDIDLQIATGESLPQTHAPGAKVYSGTINLTAPLTVRAEARHTDSFLSEIAQLVELGEQRKGRFVKIADKAARAYVPVVHTLALATFVGWLLVGAGLRPAALNAIAVLIITCPCALGLAVPAVQIVASGRLFRNGVMIRSGDVLERMADVDSVVFDKTGTLTLGRFTLSNSAEIAPDDMALAAAMARLSRHPLSQALHDIPTDAEIKNAREIAGHGVEGEWNGLPVKWGGAAFTGAPDPDSGGSRAYLKVGGREPILFAFEDTPREDAADIVANLQDQNMDIRLLTGDRRAAAADIAARLGIADWQAGVTPQDKLAVLERLRDNGQHPLMVGDGINDAPAMSAAYVSASPSSAADISRSASDIILRDNNLSGLARALDVARKARGRVFENLSLAVIYNLCAIPLAVFGFVSPLIAALAMSGSSLLVTLNALRMARS